MLGLLPERGRKKRRMGKTKTPRPQPKFASSEANFILPTSQIWQGYLSEKCNRECTTLDPISIICNPHTARGFFLVSSGAEIRPLSQWDLGDFFSNLKKKFPISKKKKFFFFFFFFFLEFSFSHHTHTHAHKLHDDNLLELHPIFLQFNGNSMCNS